jgi:hypothetical protein
VEDLQILDQRTTLFSDSLVLQREAERLGLDGSELVDLERASEEFMSLESWKIGSLCTRQSSYSLVETLNMVRHDDGVKENMFEMDLEDWESLEPRKILLCENSFASQPQELIYGIFVFLGCTYGDSDLEWVYGHWLVPVGLRHWNVDGLLQIWKKQNQTDKRDIGSIPSHILEVAFPFARIHAYPVEELSTLFLHPCDIHINKMCNSTNSGSFQLEHRDLIDLVDMYGDLACGALFCFERDDLEC